MPFKSKAQARYFFAAANKKGGLDGLSQKTAKNYIKDSSGEKLSGLPDHVTSNPMKQLKYPKLRKKLLGL